MVNICTCSLTADFSQSTGQTILPFVYTLDTENSILTPPPGENQRFCYRIEGVGQDTSQFADLSHFLLGICPEITAEMISNITVTINSIPQTVVFGEGGNVELRTENNPDPPTGCIGLKFDFELNKVGGVMLFCFELSQTFPIGPVSLCLSGGGVTVSGRTICGPVCTCDGNNVCPVEGFQQMTVCAPITVTPVVDFGDVTVTCCGEADIDTEPCQGFTETDCTFYITQSLCVAVPVIFSADVEPGEIGVRCDGVSLTGCDCPENNGT